MSALSRRCRILPHIVCWARESGSFPGTIGGAYRAPLSVEQGRRDSLGSERMTANPDGTRKWGYVRVGDNPLDELRRWLQPPLTLTCAPSESTNCASIPPKSCFAGAMGKWTPLPVISA